MAVYAVFTLLDAFVISGDLVSAEEATEDLPTKIVTPEEFAGMAGFCKSLSSRCATVTVSSLLLGSFEIAGTASDYQEWLMLAGGVMALAGVGAYLLKK